MLEERYQFRKRKRAVETTPAVDPQIQPSPKRQKQSRRTRSSTPPEFWDNLSQVPLCRRALRELKRRTEVPIAAKPPSRSKIDGDLLKRLKRFARRGGPVLRNIRGYPKLENDCLTEMSSSRPRSSRVQSGRISKSSSASKTRTYTSKDPAFRQALIDMGIHPPGHSGIVPLDDMEEIMETLARPRRSLSPETFSEETFLEFTRLNEEATSEAQVLNDVFPFIKGRANIPSGQNYLFNHLEPLARHISNPKPDYFNGSRPEEIHRQVREDLGPFIIPSNDDSRLLAPNFFMEGKGGDGNAATMKLQITQDLAVGARGMHKLQSYRQEGPIYDGKVYAIGSTYHSGTGTLQLFGMHLTPPVGLNPEPEYHTTQLKAFSMNDDTETFRKGAAAFRNAQDLTKRRREELIAVANASAIRALLEEEEEERRALLPIQYLHSSLSPRHVPTPDEYRVVEIDHTWQPEFIASFDAPQPSWSREPPDHQGSRADKCRIP